MQHIALLLLFSLTGPATLGKGEEPARLRPEMVPGFSFPGDDQVKVELTEDEAIRRIKELTEQQMQDSDAPVLLGVRRAISLRAAKGREQKEREKI